MLPRGNLDLGSPCYFLLRLAAGIGSVILLVVSLCHETRADDPVRWQMKGHRGSSQIDSSASWKQAVRGLARTLAQTLGGEGLTVNRATARPSTGVGGQWKETTYDPPKRLTQPTPALPLKYGLHGASVRPPERLSLPPEGITPAHRQ